MRTAFRDAQSALGFIQTQHYNQEASVYEVKFPSFEYADLVPVITEGNEWALGTYFYSSEIAGKMEWLAAKGFDMPYADVTRNQFVQEFHLAGIGYEWNLQEVNVAAMMGRNLGNEKAVAARRVSEMGLYNVAMIGRMPGTAYNEKNLTGLINNAAVPTANVANDGTGSTTTWSTKTPTQILRDVNAGITGVQTTTLETEMADTLLLPTAQLNYIASTLLGTASDTTILEFLRKQNVYTATTGKPLEIRALRSLAGAGASSTNRMMLYRKAPDVVRFHLPMPHRFLPPFVKSSMTTEVAGILRTGGVEFRLPKAASYLDGI
jgi:hypothetical protein